MNDTPNNISPLNTGRKEFQVGNDLFVYQFDELSLDRIFQASRLFKLDFELVKHLPKSPNDVAIIVERNTLSQAYAALLMKVSPNGGYEDYRPTQNPALTAIQKIKGSEYQKVVDMQMDFFQNSGLYAEYLQTQSNGQINDATSILKELSPEQLNTLAPLIMESIKQQTGKKFVDDTMIMDTINANAENLMDGQSSGSPPETTQS